MLTVQTNIFCIPIHVDIMNTLQILYLLFQYSKGTCHIYKYMYTANLYIFLLKITFIWKNIFEIHYEIITQHIKYSWAKNLQVSNKHVISKFFETLYMYIGWTFVPW